MEVIWVVAAIAVGVVAWLVWSRYRNRNVIPTARPMPPRATGDGAEVEVVRPLWQTPPNSISLPDIFEFEIGASVGGDGAVRILGSVAYTEGKYTWMEYFLTNRKWLGADKDEGDRLILWDRQPSAGLEPEGKAPLLFRGARYEYEERGTATYSVHGVAGGLTGDGVVKYVDYVSPDGRHYLSLERYDGDQDWEVSTGERVLIDTLCYTPPGQPASETELR